jgi:DUF2934 family protein
MNRPSPLTEERIRERAYRLWLEEGQPEGKDAEHWEKARALLALESDPEEGKEGVAEGYNKLAPWGEPVEQIAALENQGEFPTTTDQGEQQAAKQRRPTAPKQRPRVAKRRPM